MPTTAANIPPELFPLLLSYVGTDERGAGAPWERRRGEGLRDLQSCSLVCLDWANMCRPVIFGSKPVTVLSLEHMEGLEFYARHGSVRLTPIRTLLTGWELEQTWTSPSWCHRPHETAARLDCSVAADHRLHLSGPVPSGLPPSALHSPHWSLPRSMPASFTPVGVLHLADIHFPSLSSFVKHIRHFKSLRKLCLVRITWDEDDSTIVRSLPCGLAYVKAEECTDNAHLCAIAFDAIRSRSGTTPSSFGRLRPRERHVCLQVISIPTAPRPHVTSVFDFHCKS